jgi:hypothetical protein
MRDSDHKSKKLDEERRQEVLQLREFSERKLDDIRKCDSSLTEEKQRQWEKERFFLETQL